MKRNIAAFTATSYEGYYPPYISINDVDGAVQISVRAAEKDGVAGAYAYITLTKKEFASFVAALVQP